MLIGICSDTHDHVEHIRRAVQKLKELEVSKVIHAGDYCSPFTIPLFKGLPLHGIFGNNDGDKFLLMKKFEEIGAVLHGDFFSFQVEKLKIAVYHGTYSEITESLEACGKYDVVISGHTHQANVGTVGDTVTINPGSVNGFDQDPLMALFDTDSKQVKFIEIHE